MSETVDYHIIGCGVFGLTTALELKQRKPEARIRLFDRFEPPVPDGASVDTSRIVRADYADLVYAKMALKARTAWLADPELAACYHETGFVLTVQGEDDRGYLDGCLSNVKAQGVAAEELSHNDIFEKLKLPPTQHCALRGYFNPQSGWADAEATVRVLYKRLLAQSHVSFVFQGVKALQTDKDTVIGLVTDSGEAYVADQTVLATGAWQLADVPVPTLATGQVIAWIDLSAEEANRFGKNMPVLINFSSGWFVLPAYKGQLKVARHGLGYTHMQTLDAMQEQETRTISVPRTSITHPGQSIPDEGLAALREGLRLFVPEFADRPLSKTRACWYADTPRGDFLIDAHPTKVNLFVATGGSGHAFKFAPILGKEICDVLLQASFDNASVAASKAERREKWSFLKAHEALETGKGDGSRGVGQHIEWS